jgi:hypothetical protein
MSNQKNRGIEASRRTIINQLLHLIMKYVYTKRSYGKKEIFED